MRPDLSPDRLPARHPGSPTLAGVILALTLIAACSGDPTGPVDPSQVEFAAELGVDLDAMTRTSTGLYLLDEVVGDGAEARIGDSATVHYTGWLPDGTSFDSSIERGTPFTVTNLGNANVIAGWNEGLVGMREGGRRLLVIPPHLAYGPNPVEGQAWAILVFRVDLIQVGG
jgi:FKBP-type peptidyl-prolyl cis-trans isomerase FkpA